MRGIPILAICLIFAVRAAGQSAVEREWRDNTGGFSVKAKLQSVDSAHVKLLTVDGRELSVPRNRLCNDDEVFLKAAHALDESERQFQLVASHWERMITSPNAVLAILEQLHDEYPTGVAAGLIFSCAQAGRGGRAELKQAQRILDETILRLRSIQKELPKAHNETLISALNNRAILHLRERKGNQAASLFGAATKLSESVPFVIYHNATILLEISALPGRTPLDLDKGARTTLLEILARKKPEGPGLNVPHRFLYSMASNEFVSATAGSKLPPQQPKETPPPQPIEPGYARRFSGSGFIVAPTILVTNRHVVEGYEQGFRFRVKNEERYPDGILASVEKVSSTVDLALLRLSESVDSGALPIRVAPARSGETLIVLGYPVTSEFEQSLTASSGIVNKLLSEGKEVLHDAATNPGNSGGPCIDQNGNVIGVHFRQKNILLADENSGFVSGGNQRNAAVSASELLKLMSGVEGYSPLAPRPGGLPLADVIDEAKQGVFFVEVWATAGQVREMKSSEVTHSNDPLINLRILKVWPELTCFVCQGTGYRDCLNCLNGVVSVQKRVTVAINPINQQPIIGTRIFKENCNVCSGKGGFECKACSRGILPLFDK